MFCKHDWELISKDLMKAPIETLNSMNFSVNGTPSSYMYQQKLVTLVKCKKCGKIKEYVNVNPSF